MVNRDRPLTPLEASVVQWLLDHATLAPVAPELQAQVSELHVVSHCECGCPSVEFAPVEQRRGAKVLADATGATPDGHPIGVILFGHDTQLTALEGYDQTGLITGAWVFPVPESLSSACGPSAT